MDVGMGSPLAAWETFYVIIGSSAGALIGLQFVVIALLAETRRRGTAREIDAFATPTIIHFAATLLVSSVLSAPWPSLSGIGLALGICGCVGVGYVVVVIAYTALVAAALTLGRHVLASLFVVAGTALLLLFIGIHNAWDAVTFIALDHVQAPDVPDASG